MRLALVLVALSLRVLVPPGFMPGAVAGGGFPLVICTGHGPARTLDGGKAPAHPGKSADDAPCAFAGHVLGPAPEAPGIPFSQATAYATPSLTPTADLAPGRGLAAPPPPSTGPPRLL